MKNLQWIGKTDTPHQDWGPNNTHASTMFQCADHFPEPEAKGILFRKEVTVHAGLRHASVLICGLGYYQLHVNGQAIDQYVLAPLETYYRKRVLFDRHDVTALLTEGANALGVELGNARYSTPKEFWTWRAAWYGDPCLALRLTLSYEDGSEEIIETDTDWKCAYGPIVNNCFYHGETYDARLEKTGWDLAGYDDSDWQTSLAVSGPEGACEENTYFHLVKHRTVKPVCRYDHEDGRTVFDFGENIPGWVRIKVKGACGSVVRIRHAERIVDGELDDSTNRRARNTDRYILGNAPVQEYEPKFTLHGFTAAEVCVEEGEAEVLDIEAYAVYADVAQDGSFECDCAELNHLHTVIMRTQQAALMSCPYDCPQRDERLGWQGDAHVTADTCLYNFDMRRYYDKWLEDIRVNAHPETGAIPHIVPWHVFEETAIDFATGYAIVLWEHYLFYRDPSILEQHCDALIKFTDYMSQFGPILEKTRYGDWMSLTEGWVRGDPACSSSLFYYYALTILVKVLKVLGRDAELARFSVLAEEEKAAIRERFYDAENKGFDDNTQFSLAFALKLGLIPKEDEPAVVARLVADIREHDDHLTTGIFGTKFLMSALEAFGQYDVAMRLIMQKTFPSWLNMIEGRTTLPELWDGGLAVKKSQNHCMFGSVDSIFYSMLAGIRPKDDCVVIDPYFAKELGRVRAKTRLAGGSVTVEWNRTPKGVSLDVDVCDVENIFFRGRPLAQGRNHFIL